MRATPALIDAQGIVTTHAQLAAAVARGAATLAAAGAGPGRVVAVDVAAAGPALVALLSGFATGAAVWPVPASGQALGARARPILTVTAATLDGELAVVPHEDPRVLDPAVGLLLFTSGSSGPPKGVMLDHAALRANVAGILAYLPIAAHPRTALVLPLAYAYAVVGQALTTLAAGGTLLLLHGLTYPPAQVAAMAALGATGLSSVPASLRLLAEAAAALPPGKRPALGYVASAGAPLDETTRQALAAAFPAARRFNQYGATEAGPRVAAIADDDPAYVPGMAGYPLSDVTLRVLGPDGAPLPAGQEGRVAVRGPSVMRGYLDDDAASKAVMTPHGLLTGDVGHLDAAGRLVVAGRTDGVVKCAGERVALAAVAEVLRGGAGVADAHVVALPDAWVGTRLVAYIEPRTGVTPADAAAAAGAYAREHLVPAARPRRVVALAALPRLAGGKVDAEALRGMANA